MTEPDPNADLSVPPGCRSTVDRLQLVLDGVLPAGALHAEPHTLTCAACRERIAAARLLLSVFTVPAESSFPSGMTNSILAAVREDRHAQIRHRSYSLAAGFGAALVASLMLVAWFNKTPAQPEVPFLPRPLPDMSHVAPEPRPVRIGDEFSKVGQAILGTSKPIMEPVVAAPQMLTKLTDTLTLPAAPAGEFELARRSITDLPDAARTGLEPVTGTAQKAFSRLMRDFSAVQVNKPKS